MEPAVSQEAAGVAGGKVSLNHRKADEKHKSLQVVDVAVEIMTMMKSARALVFPSRFPAFPLSHSSLPLFLYKHTPTNGDTPNEIKAKNNNSKGARQKDLRRSLGLKSEKLWRLGVDERQGFAARIRIFAQTEEKTRRDLLR